MQRGKVRDQYGSWGYATTKEMKYADFLEEGWQQIFEKKYKIRKILCFSKDTEKIKRLKQEIFKETGLSVLSSFADNMEVTAPKAQKGINAETSCRIL